MAKEKIVVVEDEGNMRTMLALELESAGYQVFQAEDGEVGYQVARGVKPDLIISDILMPQMNGNQLIKKLRESEFGKNIPFIILTARGQMQDYFEMLEVDDFISKPFDAEDLIARVGRVLAKAKLKKQVMAENGSPDKGDGGKRILILDDDSQTYEKFRKILTDNGYEVNAAKTVSECLDSAMIFKPDLVALRFLLDGMNGDKLVTIMKGMPHIKDVPFVVYSQKTRDWEERSVLSAGAACFIGEVNEEKLLQAVQRTIGEAMQKAEPDKE